MTPDALPAPRFEPGTEAESARIGPHSSALLDYLLHPPKPDPLPPRGDPGDARARQRRGAIEALIDEAFGP